MRLLTLASEYRRAGPALCFVGLATLVVTGHSWPKPTKPPQVALACSSGVVSSAWNIEPASLVLADSIARWSAGSEGRAVVARLRRYPIPAGEHSRVIEGHAILRALVLLNYDLLAQEKLTRVLREELGDGRLSLSDVLTASGGPGAWLDLAAGALSGLPDQRVRPSGAAEILCRWMKRLTPLFADAPVAFPQDLDVSTGPFVFGVWHVYCTGPNGRRVVAQLAGDARRVPGLSRFVDRLVASMPRPRGDGRC